MQTIAGAHGRASAGAGRQRGFHSRLVGRPISGFARPGPQDIDVLKVGRADRDDLDEIAQAAQNRLSRPVGIRRITPGA
jgi:hypothetical protein